MKTAKVQGGQGAQARSFPMVGKTLCDSFLKMNDVT